MGLTFEWGSWISRSSVSISKFGGKAESDVTKHHPRPIGVCHDEANSKVQSWHEMAGRGLRLVTLGDVVRFPRIEPQAQLLRKPLSLGGEISKGARGFGFWRLGGKRRAPESRQSSISESVLHILENRDYHQYVAESQVLPLQEG